MIQFNVKRFAKLARWSLTNDRKYYVKNFLWVLVVLTLMFVGFSTNFFKVTTNGVSQNYAACCIGTSIMFLITIVTGPCWMFSSMSGKHDRQTLLMLPASNLEKFLMRYATWMILLPLYLVAFFAADLIQFWVNVLRGDAGITFITSELIYLVKSSSPMPRNMLHTLLIMGLWLHSFYALGGTFFRSRKFAWVLTSAAFLAMTILLAWLVPAEIIDEHTPMREMLMWDVFYAFWFVVNFWLSYRLFCRQQVIGRFVNL